MDRLNAIVRFVLSLGNMSNKYEYPHSTGRRFRYDLKFWSK